jgi:hypothetical protein
MRLMCSQNVDEVEKVKNELLRAGIAAATRRHPVAEELGVRGMELWVQDERDFFNAARLFARIQDRDAGGSAELASGPQREILGGAVGADNSAVGRYDGPRKDENGVDARQVSEPRREELKHASSLLEKGLEQMFARERELAEECALLRTEAEELRQALAQGQAALAREIERRAAAEKNLTEQKSSVASALERERHEWHRQLKCRDEALINAQRELGSIVRRLQTQQAVAAAFKEQVVSLEMQRDEHEISLCNARTEALAEREARIAAEEQADRAVVAQEHLKKQLVEHNEREQRMQAYVANLNSLFCGPEANLAGGDNPP